MKAWNRLVLGIFFLMFAFDLVSANAQDIAGLEQGLKPYGSYNGGDIDSISMVNGSLSLHIPLISYPQRGGKLHLGFSIMYNSPSLFAHVGHYHCPKAGICNPRGIYYSLGDGGVAGIVEDFTRGVAPNYRNTHISPCAPADAEFGNDGGCGNVEPIFNDYSVLDYDGANHHLGQTGPNSWISTDATGYSLNTTVTADNMLVMTDRNGIRYSYTAEPPPTEDKTSSGTIQIGPAGWGSLVKIEDTNGNLFTANYTPSGSGDSATYAFTGWTDTLGRMIPWKYDRKSLVQQALPGPNGGTSLFTVSTAKQTFSFPRGGGPICNDPEQDFCVKPGYSNASTTQSIGLPDGSAYSFAYDPVTGGISQIALPTGGTISYTWTASSTCTGDDGADENPSYSLAVTSRTVDAHDGTGPHTWNYTYTTLDDVTYPSSFQTIVTDPLGNDTVHTMASLGSSRCVGVYETESDKYAGSYTNGTLLERTVTAYKSDPDPYLLVDASGYNDVGGISGFPMNVVPISVTTTDVASGKTSETIKSYDSGIRIVMNGLYPQTVNAIYGNVLQENEYDFGNGTPGALLRTTKTAYMALSGSNKVSYLANNLLSIPYTVQVLNGSGVQASFTQYNYDEATPTASGLAAAQQLDTAPSAGAYRGNNTSVLSWLNSGSLACPNGQSDGSGSNVISKRTYFDTGEVSTFADPCRDTTSYAYSSTYNDAFPTTVTNALGQSSNNGYDFNTGLKTSETDLNKQTTTYGYDSSWRLTSVTHPDGGSQTYCYSSSSSALCSGAVTAPSVFLTETMNTNQSEQLEADTDGLGRKIKERVLSDPDGVDVTDTTYDALGRVQSVSNSYRTTADQTYGITSYQYDALNRKLYEYHSDKSYLAWSYNGNVVTSQDEVGNQWQRTTDVLGRLTKVLEPSGSSSAPSLETDYGYDGLNNLLKVNQLGNVAKGDTPRTRVFSYDSLSRLWTANNPETGLVSYIYDPNGNVHTKTDARGVITSFSYDSLNRLLSKAYSDGVTPSSCYQYDSSSVPNGSGRLTKEWTLSASSGASCPAATPFLTMRSILVYDPMGRIKQEKQFTLATQAAGTPYSPVYSYDLAGNLISSTSGVGPAPSSAPITLGYTVNAAGRLQTVMSSLGSNTINGAVYSYPTTLFSPSSSSQSSICANSTSPTPQYAAFGGLMNAAYGSGLTLNRVFDSRLRTACENDMGSVGNATGGSATVTITGSEKTN